MLTDSTEIIVASQTIDEEKIVKSAFTLILNIDINLWDFLNLIDLFDSGKTFHATTDKSI